MALTEAEITAAGVAANEFNEKTLVGKTTHSVLAAFSGASQEATWAARIGMVLGAGVMSFVLGSVAAPVRRGPFLSPL